MCKGLVFTIVNLLMVVVFNTSIEPYIDHDKVIDQLISILVFEMDINFVVWINICMWYER